MTKLKIENNNAAKEVKAEIIVPGATSLSVGSMPGALDVKSRLKKNNEESQVFLPIMFLNKDEDCEFPANALLIKENNQLRQVSSPFTLVHIISRDFCRRLDDGHYIDRCYAQLKESPGKTSPKFDEVIEKAEQQLEGWKSGVSSVFAVVESDGNATIVQIEADGFGSDTWLAVSANCCVEDQKKVMFKKNDFNPFKHKSAKGYMYVASWKVAKGQGKHWFSEELDVKTADSISEAHSRQKTQLDLYLDR